MPAALWQQINNFEGYVSSVSNTFSNFRIVMYIPFAPLFLRLWILPYVCIILYTCYIPHFIDDYEYSIEMT